MKYFRVDAVENRLDFRLVNLGEDGVLELGRGVARVAVFEVEEDHRVADARAEVLLFRSRAVGAEVHVGVVRVIKIFEEVEDRGVDDFAEEERGAKA